MCEDGEPCPPDELPDAAEIPCKERGARRAHRGDLRLTAQIEHDVDNARQDVHMLMTVRMRRMDARRLHASQLRRKLRAHLREIHAAAQDTHGQRCVIVEEDTRLRDERGNL